MTKHEQIAETVKLMGKLASNFRLAPLVYGDWADVDALLCMSVRLAQLADEARKQTIGCDLSEGAPYYQPDALKGVNDAMRPAFSSILGRCEVKR